MPNVAVVTDSVADLPPEVVEEFGITVVPLIVRFDIDVYRDGIDLSPDQFYEKLKTCKVLPATSVPPVGAFADAYDKLTEKTNEIVVISLTSKLSATYQVALEAVGLMKKQCRVEVLDSQWAVVAQGFITIAAARAARGGAGLDEVLHVASHTIDRVDMCAAFYIMSRMRKGIDIRNVGSGNMGAANVIRQIGTHEGVVVGLIDIAKGAIAILIAQALNASQPWVFAASFLVLIGHNFPVFAGFRGGRGSGTVIGIFLVLAPWAILIALAVIAIPFFTTRKFTFAILIGFALLPVFIGLFGGWPAPVLHAVAIDVFMLVRNLSGIKEVLAKGAMKDMISGEKQKKAE